MMTKTPQPVWLVRVRSSRLQQIGSRFFTDRAKVRAYRERMEECGYAVRVTQVPLLDSYKAFRKFMAYAA